MTGIHGLHHNAYACVDSEETRKFYEEFLELPLAAALLFETTIIGTRMPYLHMFFEMDNGSYLAFFEVPSQPYEAVQQDDFVLHIALEVERDHMMRMFEKGKAQGIDTRGPSDHEFIESIYFRDPNGYIIELTTKKPEHDQHMAEAKTTAHANIAQWTEEKRTGTGHWAD